MQFTPQQLAGAQRYGSKTRVGNWLEDVCLEETKVADFRRKKDRSQLAMGYRQDKLKTALQTVPHTYSEDGMLRFGDTIVLEHSESGTTLACDPAEEIGMGSREYLVSASPEHRPQARNTWIIERAPPGPSNPEYEDDILRYMQPFCLRCNDSLLIDPKLGMLKAPFWLGSTAKNAMKASRCSNQQQVALTTTFDSKTIWKAQKVAAAKNLGVTRLLSGGEAIPANTSLVLQHKATNVALSADPKVIDTTDFGTELEVCCKNHLGTAKMEALASEFAGRSTGQTTVRAEQPNNHWKFTTAADPAAAVETRNLPGKLTPEALMGRVRQIIIERTKGSFRGLRKAFQIMDDGRDLKLDREDLKWGLHDYGVSLEEQQFSMLMDQFDTNRDGLVSMNEFLSAVRGPMTGFRLEFVKMAFASLDKDGSGQVTKEDLADSYDFTSHPMVESGEMTANDVAMLFLANFEAGTKDGIVTLDEFVEYYRDISAEIDDDQYFELMMRNAWHISGGEGAAANSSNLRVMVKHSDGSQEVVECRDDLGLDVNDEDMIIDHLISQGVTDIVSIDTSGGC